MLKLIGFLLVVFLLFSCGDVERAFDQANYESLTNEHGDMEFYSGGELVKSYKNAKVIYSSSDSFALWIKTEDGKKVYWQGEALINVK